MSKKTSILIVDDDEDILMVCKVLLKKRFDNIVCCNDPRNIPSLMDQHSFHVILLDMNFRTSDNSGKEGLEWLKRILTIDQQAIVIMVTAYSSVDAAVEAMKIGAHDFIEKPWNNEKLISTLMAAVKLYHTREEANFLKQHNRILVEDVSRKHQKIIGQSKEITRLLSIVAKSAPTDANILILGENGTGKELVAHEIHTLSKRAYQPCVTVDLGAVPATLLESELFGHKKGAFTDARDDRMGRFQAANKGSLFLDEIGNLPLSLQPKLLRTLESREVTPLGGKRVEALDIRLISATNATKEELMDPKLFRPDLLYRLNTVEIVIPPLRKRIEDISSLANAFVREYSQKYNRIIQGINDQAMMILMNYPWPGNVRELRHSIERAIILADSDELNIQDFASLAETSGQASAPVIADSQTLNNIEKSSIAHTLLKHQGNITRTAKELGYSRTSLNRRIQKYGL